MLSWLLIFVPLTIGLEFFAAGSETLIFVTACLAVVPLAGWLGRATDQLAVRAGEGVGGLLNASFGNAAELIIAATALHNGLYSVVKASLTGSIIGNILLVLGMAILSGGIRYREQRFNTTAARAQATLLTLAAIALIVPATFHYVAGPAARLQEHQLSLTISVVLLFTYATHLWFSLHTHKGLFRGNSGDDAEVLENAWGVKKSLAVLAGATALIAWISEILVGSVQQAAAAFGMTRIFVGVIIVAVIGNAAEHSSAIFMALKNRMETSLQIAVGSSLQIALFVAPILVVFSRWIGPRQLDLVFTPAEVLAVFVAVLITGQIAADGESNWLEGVQLLAVYVILATAFYFLPEGADAG